MSTLELAANKGLGNVSMNMIADKVGIKKPSLYNHFASKEELVEVMYQFLREEAKKNANIGAIDYTIIFDGKSALEILIFTVRVDSNRQASMVSDTMDCQRGKMHRSFCVKNLYLVILLGLQESMQHRKDIL